MAKRKFRWRLVGRSAVTGRFIPLAQAQRDKATSIVHRVRVKVA